MPLNLKKPKKNQKNEKIQAIEEDISDLEQAQADAIARNRYNRASFRNRIDLIQNYNPALQYWPIVKKSSNASFTGNIDRHNLKVIKNTTDEAKQPGQEKSVLAHIYDDMVHIAQDPEDFDKPRFEPKTVRHMWVPFDIPYEKAMVLKENLGLLLSLSREERAAYMDRVTVVRDVADEDCENSACDKALIGHKGLFAREHIPAFTVIGAYSGIYLRNDIELSKVAQIYDPADMSDYMFRVAEDYKWPKISAFKRGNRLTIANAATNYEDGLMAGIDQAEARRTLIPVYAKTDECPFLEIQKKSECPDTLFLVVCRDMKPQQQLLYDYGPIYWANNDK
ncbi:MAG: SET domain-containing protein-lysine N-methyltransferase [Pseudomonadota bacterium]